MPAWWAPEALNFGTRLLGGIIGGKSDEQRLAEQQAARQNRNDERGYDMDLRAYNDRLGSQAMTNPYKTQLLQSMFGKLGMEAPQGMPDTSNYLKPKPYDPRPAENAKPIQGIQDAVAAIDRGPDHALARKLKAKLQAQLGGFQNTPYTSGR